MSLIIRMMDQKSAAALFRDLHSNECFLIPNPWDIGSAVFLKQLRFKALATTSAGFAFSRGLPDAPAAISAEMMLADIREIVEATELPVSADFQEMDTRASRKASLRMLRSASRQAWPDSQ